MHARGATCARGAPAGRRRKRLDVAHARAALALVEDERLDGVRRLLRAPARRATARRSHSATTTPANVRRASTASFGGPRLLQRDLVRIFSQSRLSLGFATAGDSHRSRRSG